MVDTKQVLDTYCSKMAAVAVKEYYKELSPVQYLEGVKDSDGVFKELAFYRDGHAPKEWHPVIQEHIPRNLNRSQLTRWLSERLSREPIWPVIAPKN